MVKWHPTMKLHMYLPPNTMSGQHCENYDVKREIVYCYPRNVDGNVRRSKKPKCAINYGPHHTSERTWPIGNGRQLKAMCSVVLMNRPIVVNNLLDFYSHKQPKTSLFISFDTKCFCELQASCFKFQPCHFFALEKLCWTLDEPHGNAFSRSAKALYQFLYRIVEPF